MSVLPQLERELLAAHARRQARRMSPIARLRPARGGAAVLLASAVAVAIAALAVVLVRPGHPGPSGQSGHSVHSTPPASPGPPTGPPKPLFGAHPSRRQTQELDYLYHAEGTAERRDRACQGVAPGNRTPTVSQGSPAPALLSILGVLRRPALPSDRLPTRVVGLQHTVIPNGSLPPARDIYVRYIRRARWRFGAGYYVVPAGNVNQQSPVPARCAAEQRAALMQELAHVAPSMRAAVLAVEPRFQANQRQAARPYPGVCLLALNSTGGGDVGCGSSVSDIETGHTISTGGPTGVGVVYGLVPDGVATVTVYYRGRNPGHPITVHAIGNVFIVPDPRQRFPNEGFPSKMVWRSASGAVLKTISGP